jgi:hypothetical protein
MLGVYVHTSILAEVYVLVHTIINRFDKYFGWS